MTLSSRPVAVVTGAGSGIGRAVALELARHGAAVIAIGRRAAALAGTAAYAQNCIPLPADVCNARDREKIAAAVRAAGPVRWIVHAAGVHPVEAFDAITPNSWHAVLATNVTARLFLTRELLPHVEPGARILFAGSRSATRARIGATGYCIAQAASFMLQECLKAELAPRGIHVSSAIPSPAHTPMIDAQIAADPALYPDALEYRRLRDAGQLVAPAAVGRFFHWLLTEVPAQDFVAHEWNIRDTQHHARWLRDMPLYAPAAPR